MDEFYLPEDIIEWISLKKSEYLSRLIQNVGPNDFPFEEYHRYDNLIASTISTPDWSVEIMDDDQKVKTYCRHYSEDQAFHQIILGVVLSDQEEKDIFVPIISFVTRDEALVKLFSTGKVSRPILN